MQQSCTCGSVRGASGQLASLPRPEFLTSSADRFIRMIWSTIRHNSRRICGRLTASIDSASSSALFERASSSIRGETMNAR